MRRFASGLPLTGGKVPMYDESDESPDPRTMDLSEIKDELDQTAEKMADLRKEKQANLEKEKLEAAAKAAALAAEKAQEDKIIKTFSKAIKHARKPSDELD